PGARGSFGIQRSRGWIMSDDAHLAARMEGAFRHATPGILACVARHSGKQVPTVGVLVGVVRLSHAYRARAHRRAAARDARILECDYGGGAAGARVDDLGGGGPQSASAITSSQFR